MKSHSERFTPYILLALLCVASMFFRPLLPPDETRYLTVSWEMFLARNWFVPTLNFEPYHHKPPLLFWLIDLAWALSGVGRAAAMAVVFSISAVVLHLTWRVGRALLPERDDIAERLPWLMLGNVVFIIYASLILFDLLLTACVLASFLSMLAFARGRGIRCALLAGLFVGLGVLAKGPVVLIHLAWPVLLYPWWRTEREALRPAAFHRGMGLALAAALLPVAVWLAPALLKTDGRFAYDLIWEQSAGRISGNMEASHPRPVYFYFLLLPVLGMPWVLSPTFWKTATLRQFARLRGGEGMEARYLRLPVLWGGGVIATFSLISGKQPHYLVPILPLATILFGWLMASVPLRAIRGGAIICVLVLATGQGIGSATYFLRYDLTPVATFVADHPRSSIGFVGKYQGELGFLAQLRSPVEPVEDDHIGPWMDDHPQGFLIVPQDGKADPSRPEVLVMPYRGGRLSIFGPAAPPP